MNTAHSTPQLQLPPSQSPSRLALTARLFGAPAQPPGRRVLFFQAARGERLFALAFHDPEGQYVGLDDDAEDVAAARTAAAEIGLTNITFELGRPEDPPDLGTFDLIYAGDALARRPPIERTDLLRAARELLSETGILVMDYPVLPGAANRNLARSLILPCVPPSVPVDKRIAGARAAAEGFRAMLGPSEHPYPRLLAVELRRIEESPDEVLWRDYLNAPETAFSHTEVIRLAESHGLRFVADAAWNRPEGFVAPEITDELSARGLAGAALDEALDVLRCRADRTTLFCRAESPREDPPGGDYLDELWIASNLSPAPREQDPSQTAPQRPESASRDPKEVDLTPGVEEPFSGPAGERVASPDPLLKAALLELQAAYPSSLRFAETVTRAVARLHQAGADGEPSDPQLAGLARDLWELYRRGLIDLTPDRPRFPEAGESTPKNKTATATLHALARWEAKEGHPLTTPLYTPLQLPPFEAALVRHMKEGEDEDSLVAAMLLEASQGGVTIEIGGTRLTDPILIEPMIRGLVRRATAHLAKWGLVE